VLLDILSSKGCRRPPNCTWDEFLPHTARAEDRGKFRGDEDWKIPRIVPSFHRGENPEKSLEIVEPGNDIELLSSIYTDLAQLGIQSEYYLQLLQVINSFWWCFDLIHIPIEKKRFQLRWVGKLEGILVVRVTGL